MLWRHWLMIACGGSRPSVNGLNFEITGPQRSLISMSCFSGLHLKMLKWNSSLSPQPRCESPELVLGDVSTLEMDTISEQVLLLRIYWVVYRQSGRTSIEYWTNMMASLGKVWFAPFKTWIWFSHSFLFLVTKTMLNLCRFKKIPSPHEWNMLSNEASEPSRKRPS